MFDIYPNFVSYVFPKNNFVFSRQKCPNKFSKAKFSKIGCSIGKILGLRQTKKGVKIMATAGKWLSQKVGANQVTAEGGEYLAAKSGFAYM